MITTRCYMKHSSSQQLVDAYNRMMERIKIAIESANHDAIPTMQKALEYAKQQAIELEKLSVHEAEEIANIIKRDLNDAAEHLMETSAEFSEWLHLDLDALEQKVLTLFLSVADRTRTELDQFKED